MSDLGYSYNLNISVASDEYRLHALDSILFQSQIVNVTSILENEIELEDQGDLLVPCQGSRLDEQRGIARRSPVHSSSPTPFSTEDIEARVSPARRKRKEKSKQATRR